MFWALKHTFCSHWAESTICVERNFFSHFGGIFKMTGGLVWSYRAGPSIRKRGVENKKGRKRFATFSIFQEHCSRFCSRSEKFLKKGRKIHNFCATTKFFTYFWGSTKFLIEWWGFHGSKKGWGATPLLAKSLVCRVGAARSFSHMC